MSTVSLKLRKRTVRKFSLACEQLETRTTPAVNAFLEGSLLRVIGNNGLDDSIRLADRAGSPNLLDVFEGANLRGSFTRGTQFSQVQVLVGSGNDALQLDATGLTLFYHGGPGEDILTGPGADSTWSMLANTHNEGSLNVTNTFRSVEILQGGAGNDRFAFNAGTQLYGRLDGGAGNNTLDYSNFGNPVRVSLAGGAATALGFTQPGRLANVQALVGSSGTDSLVGPNVNSTWTINAANGGTVGLTSFTGFENLLGGAGHDIFQLTTTGSISNIHGGSGVDKLDYSLFANPVNVDVTTKTATGVTNPFQGIDVIRGKHSQETLFAGDGNNAWQILSVGPADAIQTFGTVNGFRFENIGILKGGAGADEFSLVGPASSAPLITLMGEGGNDTVRGAHLNETWHLTSANGGSYAGYTFANVEAIVGGGLDDSFIPTEAATFAASIDGGGGRNWLNYGGSLDMITGLSTGAYEGNLYVNLRTQEATGVSQFTRIQNVIGGIGKPGSTGFGRKSLQIIVGDEEDNILTSGPDTPRYPADFRYSVIVGGRGADILHDRYGHELFITDSTIYDGDRNALDNIMREWGRFALGNFATVRTIVDHLMGKLSGGFNGDTLLRGGPNATIISDNSADDISTSVFSGGAQWEILTDSQDNPSSRTITEEVINTYI